MIDNVGDYLYLKNGNFKFKVDPHHFNVKWLIMLGFMDLRRLEVARHSNIGLFSSILKDTQISYDPVVSMTSFGLEGITNNLITTSSVTFMNIRI